MHGNTSHFGASSAKPGHPKPGYEGAFGLDIKSDERETQVVRCEPKRSAWESLKAATSAAFVYCIWPFQIGIGESTIPSGVILLGKMPAAMSRPSER